MFNKDSLEKASLLFEECIEISDPAKRREYLNEASRGNPELLAEVEKLLRAYEESGNFLLGGNTGADDTDEETGNQCDFKPGEIIGKYRLMGLIGEGSTSTVFLAEQEEPIHRWVALKIVKAGMDTRKVILRFGMERQALALMDHPGIAKLLDAGATSNGRPFFVMELVSGTTITQFCDENTFSLKERLQLFTEVCSAVFHAHQRGIIHRDLKPENILVSKVDERTILKIVDFGIAKVLNKWGTESGTQTGMMPFLGTPAYMSPEQVQLNSTALDTRTDIYSLGALLYELLVGHPPFDTNYLLSEGLEEMCHIIRMEEPLAPSCRLSQLPLIEQQEIAAARGTNPAELIRKLTGDLDWITLKTLEKSREQRYSTASTLIEDIKHYFNQLPVSAAKPSPTYRFKKLVKRKRKLMIAGSIAATLLFVSTFLIFTMGINAKISAKKARISEMAAMAAERESNKSMVALHVTSGLSAADNNRPDQALLWFANAARLAEAKSLPTEVHARRVAFWMAESSMPIGAFKIPGPLRSLEFDEDSQYLLAVGRDGTIKLWGTKNRKALPWTLNKGKAVNAQLSPNGLFLTITGHNGGFEIIETASGRTILSNPHITNPQLIQYSEDSRFVYFGDPLMDPVDILQSTGFNRLQDPGKDYSGNNIVLHSASIMGLNNEGWAQVLCFNNKLSSEPEVIGEFEHMAMIRSQSCSSRTDYQEEFLKTPKKSNPELINRGSRLLTRTGTYEVSIWDTATGDLLEKIDKACCSCGIATNQNTGLVACGLQGGIVGIWDAETGVKKQILPSQGSCLLDIDFGMHGTRLATVDVKGIARIWDVAEAKQVQPPMHHCTDVDSVTYASNGEFLATSQADGLVRIWNTMTSESADSSMEGAVPTRVHMSEDGSTFILTRDPAWEGSPESCIRFSTIFSTSTGRPLGRTAEYGGCVETAAFSMDSRILALGVGDCEDSSKGSLEFHDLTNDENKISGVVLPSAPEAIAIHPLEPKVAVACHNGELMVGNVGMRYFEKWSESVDSIKAPNNVQVAFTQDGKFLISLGPDGAIEVRHVASGSLRYPPIAIDPKKIWSFSLSHGGNFMATTTTDGVVTVWDLDQGFSKGKPMNHPSWVYKCRFSPDNRSLLTTSHDGYVRLWDWIAGELLADPMVHPDEVYDAAFTPDANYLLTACRDGNLRLFDPLSGHIISSPLKIGQQTFNIAISPNGSRAVLGSLNNEVSVISLDPLKKKIPFDAEELCLWGEVVSSSTIQNGIIHDLTTTEWLKKYEKLVEIHAELSEYGKAYSRESLKLETIPISTSNFISSNTPYTGRAEIEVTNYVSNK